MLTSARIIVYDGAKGGDTLELYAQAANRNDLHTDKPTPVNLKKRILATNTKAARVRFREDPDRRKRGILRTDGSEFFFSVARLLASIQRETRFPSRKKGCI
jgi:hypothetical protein